MRSDKLLLAFYGDDFTGSTDALEFLTLAGAKTILFIGPPAPEQLTRYQGLQAIGVAGMTRAMSPEQMEKQLRPAFMALRTLGARHVHYKVCSTFDSSPTIGSIGKAIDVGADIFKSPFTPLLVAAPALGRYSAFGNLFARMGIGSQGNIYRLDRHPSMSKHPITPAEESDLIMHLSKQTSKKIGLVDILHVAAGKSKMKETVENLIQHKVEVILFDAVYENQLAGIGELIDTYGDQMKPFFSVGSSGIEMALGDHWKTQGFITPPDSWRNTGKAEPLLVVSGSCSPVTESQIAWAVSNGFAEIALDTETIARKNDPAISTQKVVHELLTSMRAGKSVIVHTSRGTEDERVETTRRVFNSQGLDLHTMRMRTAQLYGTALGQIIRTAAEQLPIKRIVIAGGDTSGYVAQALGIEALEMIAPLVKGAPLCKAFAPGSPVDGIEVNFKGGQVGGEDYFGLVLQGKV